MPACSPRLLLRLHRMIQKKAAKKHRFVNFCYCSSVFKRKHAAHILKYAKTKQGDDMMRKRTIITTIMVLMTFIATDVAFAGSIVNRMISQESRIVQGLQSGELTAGETARLITGQCDIRRTRNRALSDGVITWNERRIILNKQNAASAQIYRLKHNWRSR